MPVFSPSVTKAQLSIVDEKRLKPKQADQIDILGLLPVELGLYIASHLGVGGLASMLMTSKRLNYLASDDKTWHHAYSNYFGKKFEEQSNLDVKATFVKWVIETFKQVDVDIVPNDREAIKKYILTQDLKHLAHLELSYKALLFFCKVGLFCGIQALLREQAIAFQVADTANLAIKLAFIHGHYHIVLFLLRLDLVKSQLGFDLESMFYHASAAGRTEIVREILQNARIHDEPIHTLAISVRAAAVGGHIETLNLLLDYKRIFDNIAEDNNQIFVMAAAMAPFVVVERLLQIKAVEAKAGVAMNMPLRAAIINYREDVVKRLLEIDDVKQSLIKDVTCYLLRMAIKQKCFGIIRLLINEEAVYTNVINNPVFFSSWVVKECLHNASQKSKPSNAILNTYKKANKRDDMQVVDVENDDPQKSPRNRKGI